MKVVFWGSGKNCRTTLNLMAVAGYMAYHRSFRTAIVQFGEEERAPDSYFSCAIPSVYDRQYEKQRYEADGNCGLPAACESVTYGDWAEGQHISGKTLAMRLETLIEKRLYCFRDKIPKGLGDAQRIHQILSLLECNMDYTFINLNSHYDDWAKRMMWEADLLVVNIEQTIEAFDTFFLRYANLSPNIMLLIGDYLRESKYDRQSLRRIYRIPAEEIAVIPSNSEFQLACELGRLNQYMKRGRNLYLSEKRQYFMQELDYVVQILCDRLETKR